MPGQATRANADMLYKFKCKAAGDVLMLGPQGNQLLALLGRQPAAQGIIEPSVMAAAIQALQRAAEDDAAQRAQESPDELQRGARSVSLKQRVWPMIDMLRQAQAANEPIVWGV